ncbi:MAG: trypsin-like peptidase domain-containing protein [Planctomycetes bacterium]|nr:trypsin-like peptidase domain-containing protein [Planctomycetota bacterium]
MKKFVVLGFLVIALGVAGGVYLASQTTSLFVNQNSGYAYISPAVADLQESVAETCKKVIPSVVHLTTKQKVVDPFSVWSYERESTGVGSGVIITKDGYIVTNKHVIQNANSIYVALADGQEGKAKVIYTDLYTDLAIIKLNGFGNLMPAAFGNSDSVRIGDFVLAVGSPFGYHHSVTFGIVGSKGRKLEQDMSGSVPRVHDFIQTDAALNPGNSGGALVNLHGEVVGINSLIITKGTNTYTGVGLAYTSNIVKRIVDDVLEFGKFRRGYIGINPATIDDLAEHLNTSTELLVKELGLEKKSGVVIGDVGKDTPAEKAGLQQFDIIIEVDGKPINSASDLILNISLKQPGSSVQLLIMRNKRKLTKEVQVAEFPTK